ncbi:MAG: glycoside hydrolase family 32 protein [Clostridiales bacterium]|jgi:beta-fructofuranosidase|nr:glycoside hydrolase family 32 protein [Clostridiales bacterium]
MLDANGKDDFWRLNYHLMPPSGWMNDPNGLCWFNGCYHVFYQYTPNNPNGALKYWGHYSSTDMINWDEMGIALSPDTPFDRDGVYSGSALAVKGKMHLFYTGNVKFKGSYDYITEGREGNTIHVSSEDGVHFGEKSCVIAAAGYPPGMSCHIRDPKVWQENASQHAPYFLILGARTLDNRGQALIYQSPNLECWDYIASVCTENYFGYMWECPDVFQLNGINILSISPQGVEPDGYDYQNTYQSGYFQYKGSLTGEYELGGFKEWDRGFDFYAPQTFEDKEGRRIMIGWMGMPDTPQHVNPTITDGWQHALTLPREIFSCQGRIFQRPITEIEELRMEGHELPTGKETPMMASYEALILNSSGGSIKVSINARVSVEFNKGDQEFFIEFHDSALGGGRAKRSARMENCFEIRLFVDTSSVEIFINGGEEVFSTRFYPEDGRSCLSVTGEGFSGKYWQLKPLTINNKYGIR